MLKMNMKRLLVLVLSIGILVAIVSCSDVDEETFEHFTETTTDGGYDWATTCLDHGCTTEFVTEMTSSKDDIAPLDPHVTVLDANGNEMEYYSELVYFTDGMVVGDGILMFMSVSSRLPQIKEKIPIVDPCGIPTIVSTAREGVSVKGGTHVNVYGEDYALLAERLPISELCEKGNTDWKGMIVYVYFTVLFTDETPDYEKRTENGYFMQISFDKGELPSRLTPELVLRSGETVPFYREWVMFTDGFTCGDGALVFSSVEEHLTEIKEKIPGAVLEEGTVFRIPTKEDLTVSGGEMISVYDESFALLGNYSFSDIVFKMNHEWKGTERYLVLMLFIREDSHPVCQTDNAYYLKAIG